MKAVRLIRAIEQLVTLADKEIYYRKNNLHLGFSSGDSNYVIGSRDDGSVFLSVYFGYEMGFKFYLEKDGTLHLEEGSTPTLLEYSGLERVLNLINQSGEALLAFGREAIEAGNYEFKTMEQVKDEINKIRREDKKRHKDPVKH